MHLSLFLFVCLSFAGYASGEKWSEEVRSLVNVKDALKKHKNEKMRTVGGEFKFYSKLLTTLPKGIVGVVACQKASDLTKSDIRDCDAMRTSIAEILACMNQEDKVAQDIVKSIDWKDFGEHARKIFDIVSSVEAQLLMFLEAPLDVATMFQDLFKTSYLNYMNQPVLVLRKLILERSTPVSVGMLDKAREMKKNDMRPLSAFAAFMMRNLLRTVVQEFAYLSLEDKQKEVTNSLVECKNLVQKISKRGEEADSTIWDSWSYQSFLDVDDLGKNISASSNTRLTAEMIHSTLQGKYPNRKWFVLVHKSTDENDKDRFYTNCHDYRRVWGSNVVLVNSVDAKSKGPGTNLKAILSPIADYEDNYPVKAEIAKLLYQRFNRPACDPLHFAGAIEAKANPEVKAPVEHIYIRLVAIKRYFHSEKPYYLYAFA